MTKKATYRPLTYEYLQSRAEGLQSAGYPVSKWIDFCLILMEEGYQMKLYEARNTVSKYIYVRREGSSRVFKVRFSNHAPIPAKEANGDCDFFVGRTNFATTTTAQALDATRRFFQPITQKG